YNRDCPVGAVRYLMASFLPPLKRAGAEVQAEGHQHTTGSTKRLFDDSWKFFSSSWSATFSVLYLRLWSSARYSSDSTSGRKGAGIWEVPTHSGFSAGRLVSSFRCLI